jgi:hypothetical protein
VVEEMDGVVKLVPVPRLAPPDDAVYQLIVPEEAVAPNVTVPVPQLLPGVVDVMVGITFTTIDMLLLETGFPDKHGVALEVNTTVTTLPFVSVVVVNVLTELLLPTFKPFTLHWYNGDEPPLVGVAVNVTELPAQIVFPGFAEILTEGVKMGFIINSDETPAAYIFWFPGPVPDKLSIVIESW